MTPDKVQIQGKSSDGPDLPVLHLLHTVMDYGPATAADLRQRYNDECKYDEFDPLPMRSVRSIASTLAVLRSRGFVTSLHHGPTAEWQITDQGRETADSFVGTEYVPI